MEFKIIFFKLKHILFVCQFLCYTCKQVKVKMLQKVFGIMECI
jgi:hypothetical protein